MVTVIIIIFVCVIIPPDIVPSQSPPSSLLSPPSIQIKWVSKQLNAIGAYRHCVTFKSNKNLVKLFRTWKFIILISFVCTNRNVSEAFLPSMVFSRLVHMHTEGSINCLIFGLTMSSSSTPTADAAVCCAIIIIVVTCENSKNNLLQNSKQSRINFDFIPLCKYLMNIVFNSSVHILLLVYLSHIPRRVMCHAKSPACISIIHNSK